MRTRGLLQGEQAVCYDHEHGGQQIAATKPKKKDMVALGFGVCLLLGTAATLYGGWTSSGRVAQKDVDRVELAEELGTFADFIVIGAGSAGSVVASKLVEAGHSVILMEQGPDCEGVDANGQCEFLGSNGDTVVNVGSPSQWPFVVGNSKLTHTYYSAPTMPTWMSNPGGNPIEPALQDGSFSLPRTQMVGGCSQANAMIWVRGGGKYFDRLGEPEWSWNALLPKFKAMENNTYNTDPKYHGTTGPVTISHNEYAPHADMHVFRAAAERSGHPINHDFNGEKLDGVGWWPTNSKDGKRVALSTAFLTEKVRNNPKFKLLTGVQVTKIIFDGTTAVGVEAFAAVTGGRKKFLVKKEIILSGGTFLSPQLLMVSGVGPRHTLEKLKIPVVKDLKGVGMNLMDHGSFNLAWPFKKPEEQDQTNPKSTLTPTGLFYTSSHCKKVNCTYPDMNVFVADFMPGHTVTIHALGAWQESSPGFVSINSASPFDPPSIHQNYLGADADVDRFVESVSVVRDIISQAPSVWDMDNSTGSTYEEIKDFVTQNVKTNWHPIGTCKMGKSSDPWSVVSPRLKVHGLDGLRVIDASVLPLSPPGPINPAVSMVGYNGADIILEDQPQPPIVLGSALAAYHNVSVWIYQKALKQLGYNNIKVVTNYEHEFAYAMFTGGGGLAAGCKDEGCSEYCEKAGVGSRSPCIDFMVDANIPVNHAVWLEPYQDQFDVMGTAFEDMYIGLFVPDYVGNRRFGRSITNISEAAVSPRMQKTIYSWKGGLENGCRAGFCPLCNIGKKEDWLTTGPLHAAGFNYVTYHCPDFETKIAQKLKNEEEFLVMALYPHFWLAKFPELVPLQLEQFRDNVKPNQGKAMIRKDSISKFSSKARSVLQAIFIGSENMQEIDGWSMGFGNDPPGRLCDYQTWNNNCAEEAAQKWIDRNQDSGSKRGVWPSFFW